MKKQYFIGSILFFIILSFYGCISMQQSSNFTFENIQKGMSKEAIIAKFGKPYKENFRNDTNNVLIEDWYYKEILYKSGAGWYELNSILHLQDGKLVSYEMGNEQRLTEYSAPAKKSTEQ